jgi:hypothetical protein
MSNQRNRQRMFRNTNRNKATRKESLGTRELKYRPGVVDRLKTALQSGPVKTWADMTAEERAEVLKSLKR